MDATDFLQATGSDVYSIEVHSDEKDESFIPVSSVLEHGERVGLFDIGKDVDDYLNNVKSEMEFTTVMHSSATEDESMAAEALRQLGSSTVFNSVPRIETKTPQDLPLLPCSSCQLEFKTTADLNNHLSICKHTRFKCYVCDKVFEQMRDLNTHLLSHMEDKYLCRLCSSQFKDKKQLSTHMLAHGNITTVNQCPVCGNLFNRPSSLSNHMKVHTYQAGRAILNMAPKILETTHLSDILGNEANENANKRIPLPSLNSLIWNLHCDVKQQDNLNTDFNIGANVMGCLDNKECASDAKKNIESIMTMKEETIDKRPYVCIYCNKCFTREKALICHLKLHSDLLENFFQCDACEENFNSENSLCKHQTLCKIQMQPGGNKSGAKSISEQNSAGKTKVNKHACDECGKSFSTRQKLGRHMWIHRKKIHTCEICLNTFDKQEDLDSHRLSMHYKSSPYVCTECGKNFSSRQGLWEHSRIHGDESSLYKCAECLKTFSSRQGYLIHKRKHSDERPYGCRFCWKTFRDGGTLRKHERIHTGERPHACPLCGKAFNQKVVLREHVRWLHTANKQPDEDGLLHCTLCDIKVSDREVLCAHIVKHSDKMALLAKDGLKKGSDSVTEKTDKTPSETQLKDKEQTIVKNTDREMLNFIQDLVETVECDLCGDKFYSKIGLTEHIRVHI